MLQSKLLSPNSRLQQAAKSPPSIRKRPPDDDADAVRRIQKALAQLGHKLPKSFPGGPNLEPDGLFGPETESAVREFQKKAFPGKWSEWDGRCGSNTLSKLDSKLGKPEPYKPQVLKVGDETSVSRCRRAAPAGTATPPGKPVPYPNLGKVAGKAARQAPGTPWARQATRLKNKIR